MIVIGSKLVDTGYTDEPVCPHCGHILSDGCELGGGIGDEECGYTECDTCEKQFMWTRHVSVRFSTKPMESRRADLPRGTE